MKKRRAVGGQLVFLTNLPLPINFPSSSPQCVGLAVMEPLGLHRMLKPMVAAWNCLIIRA